MLLSGILIAYLLGLSITYLAVKKISVLEYLGLSFLIGMGGITFIMFFLDIVGLKITPANIFMFAGVIIAGAIWKLFLNRKELEAELSNKKFTIPDINLVWILLVSIIIILEFYNFSKCLYFPTHERDSVAGFETIGWIISQEYTIRGLSIFQPGYVSGIDSASSYINYIPMVQLCHAYAYLLGAEMSKIIMGLLFLHFIIAFYACARNYIGTTASAFATLCVIATPDFLAFSSLSGTNVINAIFASLGVIYTFLWLKEGSRDHMILAIILNALGLWTSTPILHSKLRRY